MTNVKITGLTSLTSGQVDRATDVLEIADVSATQSKKITPNALMGISGAAVGDTDSQTLTNKTITTPAISSPVLSGTVSGTYTLGGTPTFPSSVATLTGSQTLTNKVLTSPTINTATIVNPTITADSIAGFSVSNTGTIYGVAITTGTISGSVLASATVTNAKLSSTAVNSSVVDWTASGQIWWQELGSTSGTTLSLPSITARKYLKIIAHVVNTGGTIQPAIRFNNDSGANYAARVSDNGGADTTVTAQTNISFDIAGATANPTFVEVEVINLAVQEKLCILHTMHRGAAGAATAPARRLGVYKWANTAAQVTRVDVILVAGTGTFDSTSTLVVLGHD